MDLSRYLTMDSNMLLSIVNMKLRNEADLLAGFCLRYELDEALLTQRLAEQGWHYQASNNQFVQA